MSPKFDEAGNITYPSVNTFTQWQNQNAQQPPQLSNGNTAATPNTNPNKAWMEALGLGKSPSVQQQMPQQVEQTISNNPAPDLMNPDMFLTNFLDKWDKRQYSRTNRSNPMMQQQYADWSMT